MRRRARSRRRRPRRRASAARHHLHDLELVAAAEDDVAVALARHDLAVAFHDDNLRVQILFRKKLGDGHRFIEIDVLAVHSHALDLHMSGAACRGAPGPTMAKTPAPPRAPASRHGRAFVSVMPPMAMTGMCPTAA